MSCFICHMSHVTQRRNVRKEDEMAYFLNSVLIFFLKQVEEEKKVNSILPKFTPNFCLFGYYKNTT